MGLHTSINHLADCPMKSLVAWPSFLMSFNPSLVKVAKENTNVASLKTPGPICERFSFNLGKQMVISAQEYPSALFKVKFRATSIHLADQTFLF
jgi:hypothetical protein